MAFNRNSQVTVCWGVFGKLDIILRRCSEELQIRHGGIFSRYFLWSGTRGRKRPIANGKYEHGKRRRTAQPKKRGTLWYWQRFHSPIPLNYHHCTNLQMTRRLSLQLLVHGSNLACEATRLIPGQMALDWTSALAHFIARCGHISLCRKVEVLDLPRSFITCKIRWSVRFWRIGSDTRFSTSGTQSSGFEA